jgi:hypothetical protein
MAIMPTNTNFFSSTATLLPNGKVLIDGEGDDGYRRAALYDPFV